MEEASFFFIFFATILEYHLKSKKISATRYEGNLFLALHVIFSQKNWFFFTKKVKKLGRKTV